MATARSLESLRDRMPRLRSGDGGASSKARSARRVAKYFSSFGEPVAAASIAQVHRATAGGEAVAVKVARPGVERRFAKDLGDMMYAARFAESRSDEAQRLRLTQVVETLAREREARNGFPAGGRRRRRIRRATTPTIRNSSCRPSTGTARRGTC